MSKQPPFVEGFLLKCAEEGITEQGAVTSLLKKAISLDLDKGFSDPGTAALLSGIGSGGLSFLLSDEEEDRAKNALVAGILGAAGGGVLSKAINKEKLDLTSPITTAKQTMQEVMKQPDTSRRGGVGPALSGSIKGLTTLGLPLGLFAGIAAPWTKKRLAAQWGIGLPTMYGAVQGFRGEPI